MSPPIVIQFAKLPKLGHVKTRLEPRLAKQGSYDLHIKLVNHIHGVLCHSDCESYLFFDQLGTHPALDVFQHDTQTHVQQGQDLGERMLNALQWGLQKSDKAIIVGSDCPVIDSVVIQKAIDQLNQSDMVFVPAEDGGYVLVGAARIDPGVFEAMPWGSDQVMAKTIEKLEYNGTTFGLLDTLWDVDRPEDYDRLVAWDDRFRV